MSEQPKALNHLEEAQLQKILANWRLTPATYAYKISRGAWIPSPHLLYASYRVAVALKKGNARIIISMPPRHGKSQLFSIYTPAWLLEIFGKINIILTSYGADLAEGFSNKVRGIIKDEMNASLLKAKIGDISQAGQFSTTSGGYMFAVGLGGAITGRGADVLLIDDYIKEIKEALSPAYRDYIWNWYVTTALTRLEPNGSVIVIATRWHSDDLIGRLKSNERDDWEYIEIPAIARESDMTIETGRDRFGRDVGEALFPARYPIERLLSLKKSLGTVFFEALFQQRPVDETMRMTDTSWLKIWPLNKVLPKHIRVCRIWDLAATEGGGDWLTGTKAAWDPKSDVFVILDIFRAQLGAGKVEDKVAEYANQDGYGCDIGIEQEPGSAGKILVQHFKSNVLRDFRVHSIPVSKAKVVRAQPFLAACEDGRVYYYPNITWNKAFVDEFEVFPSSSSNSHDDQIDTAAGAYSFLTGRKSLSVSWGRKSDSIVEGSGINANGISKLALKGTRNSNALQDQQSHMANAGLKLRGATWGSRRNMDV